LLLYFIESYIHNIPLPLSTYFNICNRKQGFRGSSVQLFEWRRFCSQRRIKLSLEILLCCPSPISLKLLPHPLNQYCLDVAIGFLNILQDFLLWHKIQISDDQFEQCWNNSDQWLQYLVCTSNIYPKPYWHKIIHVIICVMPLMCQIPNTSSVVLQVFFIHTLE
jgi:hypothetical protein